MDIKRTVETSASPDQVFAYLSDFETTNEWDPGTVETRRVSGDGGVGTVYRNVSEFNGRKSELTYVVRERVSPTRFRLEGTNKTLTAVDTMTFEGTPSGGTRVTYHANFTFKGVLGLLSPVLGIVLAKPFKKLGDEAEQGMREALAKL